MKVTDGTEVWGIVGQDGVSAVDRSLPCALVPPVTETLLREAEVQNKFRNRKRGKDTALLVWS